jgi:tetratricopeptide (TPR) repeat protein
VTTGRAVDLRLARLHLRGGLVALARAELEAAAGRGLLDVDGLADLAEARWRTGDLVGAAVAAEAHLGGGGDALVALVVAAEAHYAEKRLAEAGAAAAAAVEAAVRTAGPAARDLLVAVFAGLPMSPLWDGATTPPGRGAAGQPAPEAVGAPDAGSVGAPRAAPGAAVPASPVADLPGPPDWLALAEAAIVEGRLDDALGALGIALRRRPSDAAVVLATLARLEGPGVELLRGDALRLLGREDEAELAYRAAEARLHRSLRA